MRKVLPHIHLLKLGLANAYLLEEENELSLIDTGPEGSEQRIFNYIHGIGRNPEELTQIIVTHSHPDHAGSAAALKKATRARIYMHPKDADMVAAGKALRNGGQISPGIIHKNGL
ncbi:MAG: MBL fold metallo-hydrolase [Owenweeksia sp.]|nr:MBL fold metallo-hydrolase [Owenweeksia sp.]